MSVQRSSNNRKQRRFVNPFGPSSSRNLKGKKRQAHDAVNVGLHVVDTTSEGMDVLGPLMTACRTTKSILEVAQATENNQQEWKVLTCSLKEHITALQEQIALFQACPPQDRVVDQTLSRPLVTYVEFLENMHSKIVELQNKRSLSKLSFFKAFTKVEINVLELSKHIQDIVDQHRQFMVRVSSAFFTRSQQLQETLSSFTALRTQITETDTEVTKANAETILTGADLTAIFQLPMVTFVASSVHRTCLKGTRVAVLEMIDRWAHDTSEKPIFWLCDIAGSGKSTVAMTAAESWRRQGVLGGQFFFSIASSEGSTTEKFCSTIARELIDYIPDLAPYVAASVKRYPSFMRSSLEEQFRVLITQPLCHWRGCIILVIDALDECKSGSQRREIVETLAAAVGESNNLKIFMTSRPDPVIRAALESHLCKFKLEDRLHDINHRDNINDIAAYIHKSLDGVLPESKRQGLVEKANGLFIWASTACRMLNSETNLNSPETTYDRLISIDETGAIDDLYSLIFERMNPEYYTVMYRMLALLLGAYEPLTTGDLDDILKHAGENGSAKALVRNLGSVLAEDASTNLIQFRHPTFIEYLRRRSNVSVADGRDKLHINISNAHGQVASWCLKYLTSRINGLKFNICQLASSFYLNREIPDLEARVSRCIPRRLQYASSHWLFHMAETDDNWRSVVKQKVQHVIQVPYVLYWMEILSFTGGVARAILGLQAIIRHQRLEEANKIIMEEIRQFMMAFSVPIQDSAPHIYISALPFTPTRSRMHKEGLGYFTNTLSVTQGLDEVYQGLPRVLVGHDDSVNAILFFPNGSYIVSCSDDETIRIWDADTGQPRGEPLQGHESGVRTLTFSPDGSLIVSGSDDNTIRLWDAVTGRPEGEPFQGHNDAVNAIVFFPDGRRIASGSRDGTIRLWDADTGQPLGDPLRGHEDSVNALVLSSDGLKIFSGSDDCTIRVWDAVSGQALEEPIRGHEGPVNALAFSLDGLQIISGSSDNTIRMWNVESGQQLGEPLRDHEDWVVALSFSPDGSVFASGSFDNTIRLWDAKSLQSLGEPLQGHESPVTAISFSPDGSCLFSGSSDNMIRSWD
ncbi:related to WD40-repeat protein (notchless protein), partial [Serendipita indica DSM 11827]